MSAFEKFNGRWYCKRQLSCQFTAVDNWKSAICGLFHHKKCPKGKNCNFLHVFQNPAPLRHIKSSGHTRERPENSWQGKHSRHSSHYKSSSRSLATDFDSLPNQLSSESYRRYRLKSSAENGKSRMSSKDSRSSHHGLSYSQSRDRRSYHRTNRSKSRSPSRHSRRSVSKVSTFDQSYSLNSPLASEQCHASQTLKKSSKSSKVSHEEHHLLSKALSKTCRKHCTSQSHKKHKRSKSHKHHHHSKDKSAPQHHMEDGSKKSPTYLYMIHQPSKSVHLESDSELGADKEDKDTYAKRNKIRENHLSPDSAVESVPMSSGVDKCLTDHQLHQEGDDVEEQYDHTITKKRKKRRIDRADTVR